MRVGVLRLERFDRFGWLIALILGAVSAFAFEPAGLWPLMPLALAVLCELIARAGSLRRALALGWLFGLGQFALGLNWIATAFTFQAAMPAWLGWIAVALVALYLAVYPALAAGLGWRFGKDRPLALVLALAGGWAICEWLRGTIFTGFPWNPAAATFIDTPLLQLSALVGTYGLSMAVVLLGGALWLAYRRSVRTALAIPVAVALLALVPTASIPRGGDLLRPIRIVQPNIPQERKWRPGLADEAFSRLGRLAAGGSPPPRLVFWPEVAVPEPFQIIGADRRPLAIPMAATPRALQSVRAGDALVTGGFALVADGFGKIVGNTNSVFALGSDGQLSGRYDKAHLVPYGEYLPMRPLLSAIGLSKLAPGQGDTSSGPGPRTLDLPGFGRMGVQICYEIIFSGDVVDRADRPDFIFNPSNDAWFGRWGPPQHLALARLRAAEEGLPVIRATPTGISALIDAHGRVVQSLPWRKAGAIDAVIPPASLSPTPFARGGNLIPLSIAFALLISAIALGAAGRYRRVT